MATELHSRQVIRAHTTEGQAAELKLLRTVGKGTWVLAGIASIALWVLVLLVDGLDFLMSYTQPVGTYTGQDGDRDAFWVLLGMLVAASALAVVVVRLPARYQRLRASARSGGHGVREWLAHQQGWWLARMLTGFNCPIMIVAAVLVALVATATSFHNAPAGALLWAAAGGAITAAMTTAAEVFLLRYGMLHRKTRAQSLG
ncbi:MAG TPA: hypothetical protein VF940_25395 [Streptosporangiaceae bacterium]